MAGNDYGWYPGHMTKSVRAIREELKLVDLCIEVLDSRIPLSSRNPDIDELAKGKFRMVVLNKADLSDERKTALWTAYFREKGIESLVLNAKEKKASDQVKKLAMTVCAEKIERDRKRGIVGRPVRAMVCGIPNVGKSTLINSITGKAPTKTGNKPGVTRSNQWVKTGAGIELLDTPGLLWPKFEDRSVGLKLAAVGSINDQILNTILLASETILLLRDIYPDATVPKYEITLNEKPEDVLKAVAERNGLILKGADPDIRRAAETLLAELRSGKLGRMTLEEP
jgi:ribosome biogenesis GTPase A